MWKLFDKKSIKNIAYTNEKAIFENSNYIVFEMDRWIMGRVLFFKLGDNAEDFVNSCHMLWFRSRIVMTTVYNVTVSDDMVDELRDMELELLEKFLANVVKDKGDKIRLF